MIELSGGMLNGWDRVVFAAEWRGVLVGIGVRCGRDSLSMPFTLKYLSVCICLDAFSGLCLCRRFDRGLLCCKEEGGHSTRPWPKRGWDFRFGEVAGRSHCATCALTSQCSFAELET